MSIPIEPVFEATLVTQKESLGRDTNEREIIAMDAIILVMVIWPALLKGQVSL